MDAVLEYCKTKELEPESVTASLTISKSLKDKNPKRKRLKRKRFELSRDLQDGHQVDYLYTSYHFIKGEGFTD